MTGNIFGWDPDTAANNDDIDGDINWAEGQMPSTVNNSARAMMMRIAQFITDTTGKLKVAGTGNAFTVATKSANATLAEPLAVAFEADRANTAAATLAIDGLTAKPLYNAGGIALTGGEIQDGGVYQAVYNAALDGFIVLNVSDSPKTKSGLHAAKNLYIATTGNATLDITAEELFVGTTDDRLQRLRSVSVSVNMGTTGAGGRDTGVEQASKIYYLHVIWNSTTNTTSAIASLSRYSPTVPAGYDFRVFVGAVKNNGSSNLATSKQWGATTYILTGTYNLASGTATSSSVSLTDLISSTANKVSVSVEAGSFGSSYTSIQSSMGVTYARSLYGVIVPADVPVDPASPSVIYNSTDGSGSAMILGWTER